MAISLCNKITVELHMYFCKVMMLPYGNGTFLVEYSILRLLFFLFLPKIIWLSCRNEFHGNFENIHILLILATRSTHSDEFSCREYKCGHCISAGLSDMCGGSEASPVHCPLHPPTIMLAAVV